MAYSPSRFAGPVAIPSVPTNLVTFTQPAIVKQIMITNVTGGTLNFSFYLIPSGGQVGDNSNKLYGDYPIQGNAVLPFNLSLVVGAGESIYAVANVPNALNVVISGVTAA
jgi:hypothetical protein